MKFALSCLLFLVFLFHPFQETGFRKLTVEDYKGKPDGNSHFLALTGLSISFKILNKEIKANHLKLRIQAFNTIAADSWIKLDEIRDKMELAQVLDHEQGHYDINEKFRIILEKKINETLFDRDSLSVELIRIQNKMRFEYDAIQKDYDLQTNHMYNLEKQAEWKKRIADLPETPSNN